MWQPVAAQLNKVAKCWALDFRGHGDSEAGSQESYHWQNMADDVLAVVGALDPPPRFAVGHSLGAASILRAELACRSTFDRVWLYEPIVLPKEALPKDGVKFLADVARARQHVFESPQAAYDRYSTRAPLSMLDTEVLRIYVDSGFRELPDGTVTMKCIPEVEATVFENIDHVVFEELSKIGAAVTVCGSADTDPPALYAPKVAEVLPNATFRYFERLTHFGPLENPQEVAASISEALFEN